MTGKVSQEAGPSSGAISLAGVVLCFGAAIFTVLDKPEPSSKLDAVWQHVPAARAVFDVRGKGFVANAKGSAISDTSSLPKQRPTDTVRASAPARADGAFEVSSLRSSHPLLVRLVGAAGRNLRVEKGAAVYDNVHPNTDVITVRDPERFAINYVVRDTKSPPQLALRMSGEDAELRPEPGTGAVLIQSDDGRARLKVLPPTAIDAAGAKRRGNYDIYGDTLRIALNLSGMRPPVVVDPVIMIPYWVLKADARQPGTAVRDPQRGAVETQIAHDSIRNRFVAIHPKRSVQFEDTAGYFGVPTYAVPTVSDKLRRGTPTFSPFETNEWTRTFSAQTETWEWTNGGWRQADVVGLPALIDPATAYDPLRERLVVFGGIRPEHSCLHPTLVGEFTDQSRCRLTGDLSATFEFDGQHWSERKIAGAPPPRVRAAMGRFKSGVVLYGGRSVLVSENLPWIRWYDAPFPEDFTQSSLNDTWLFDGNTWRAIATSNPPPPLESGQLVYDERRERAVLIGGFVEGAARFGIWEFDGKDWVTRIQDGMPNLPVSLQHRRAIAAFWHPGRRSIILFGGFAEKFESCPLSGAELQNAINQSQTNAVLKQQLTEQGCLGGYAHDSWEWNGSALTQLTEVAFGGFDGDVPVFRQLARPAAWSGQAPPFGTTTQGPFKLLPWRYDQRPNHFRLRSVLERTHANADLGEPGDGTVNPLPAAPPPPTFVSPLFSSSARPAMHFDAATSNVMLFQTGQSRVFNTDGSTWTERTPQANPFSAGTNDFFATAWDSISERAVLFDPLTGATWVYTDSTSWSRVTTPSSPGIWTLPPSVRLERDLRDEPDGLFVSLGSGASASNFETASLKQPRMTFDRQRGRVVMLYKDALWEFNGAAWQQFAVPSGLMGCAAATLMAYDGARNRVVVVGCKIPATTWEWNGSAWAGPFASPYQAPFVRNDNGLQFSNPWQGSLQFGWAHPNALFESQALGGVGVLDADGTLRVWNGSTWLAGPKMQGSVFASDTPSYVCDHSATVLRNIASAGVPLRWKMVYGWDFIPTCFQPPLIEDSAANRIVAFRDGPAGSRQIQLGVPAAQRKWEALFLGRAAADPREPRFRLAEAHPHPFEMWSPEHVYLVTRANPASRTEIDGSPLTTTSARAEDVANNLFWPFRVLVDPVHKRVRMLTHRGAMWEQGGEPASSLGGPCQSLNDCAEGSACVDGVCCNYASCGRLCTTCRGSQPGICEAIPRGQPDPRGRCGSGECAQVCPGAPPDQTTITCIYEPGRTCGQASCNNGVLTARGQCSGTSNACVPSGTPTACAGGLGCADATSCRTSCQTRADCEGNTQHCDPITRTCVPDTVAQRASARGIPTVNFSPPAPPAIDPTQTLLQEVEPGVFALPTQSGGLRMAIDSNRRTPLEGLGSCLHWIKACFHTDASIDSCVVSAPRCASVEPWLHDEELPCCPEQCLDEYLDLRDTKSESDAFPAMVQSGCYPGLPDVTPGGTP